MEKIPEIKRLHEYGLSERAISRVVGVSRPVVKEMFIDFAGKKLHITDKRTGEITDVEVFVAILAASVYTYVEAVASQQKADFISATQNAFHYFGGVPLAVVPDCLKSAVTNPCKYEPDINPYIPIWLLITRPSSYRRVPVVPKIMRWFKVPSKSIIPGFMRR